MTTRKKYSKEFKLDAISLVTDQGYSRAEAARSLGIYQYAVPVGARGTGWRWSGFPW
jgi:transposase-like protein